MTTLEVGAKIRCKRDYSISTKEGNVYEIAKVVDDGAGGYIYHYVDDEKDPNDMETIGHDYLTEIFEVVPSINKQYAKVLSDALGKYGNPYSDEDATDNVNHPSHYTQGSVEVIDIIAQITSGYTDGFHAYCVGNALKYLARAPHKHATIDEDVRKAAKYLEFITDGK